MIKLSSAILYCIIALLPGTYAIPVVAVALNTRAPQTMYHATCTMHVEQITKDVNAGALHLRPNRQYPNEFSWSGLFFPPDYVKS
jgi:hypothetical protein